MNRQKKIQQQQQKHRGRMLSVSIWGVCIGLAIAASAMYFRHSRKIEERNIWNKSTQGMLLQSASPVQIDSNFRPVMIYRYRGTKRPAFTGVGTWFVGTNGPIVATVEHILAKKFTNELFLLRFLSPDGHSITNGIQSIAYRNIEAGLPGEMDVVFLRPGNPQKVECFSDQEAQGANVVDTYLFDNVEVGGRVIRRVKSLVTGNEYPVVGASKMPPCLAINYPSQAGESGTGFVDEYGQLYVLSSGTRGAKPLSLLSGPFENIGKRL